MNRFALSLVLGLSTVASPALADTQQNTTNSQSNSGTVSQSPVGGINHNTQVNNNSISEYSFGPGISCPTPGLAFSSSYAGADGGFNGYSASVSFVMPLGGDIGTACRDLAVEIARQRQLDTKATMIQQCASMATKGIQIDVAQFPEFAVCSAVKVNGVSAVK